MPTRTAHTPRLRRRLLAAGPLLFAAGALALPAAAQPADQPALDSPSVETAVPAAQPQALTIPPAAKKNWDRDKDGELDRSEFTRFFGKAKVFEQFDHDGSGALESNEFDRGLFGMIDGDANAVLDEQEWVDAERWQKITPNGIFENFDDNHDDVIDRAEFRALPAANGEEMFESWDVDGDGEIQPSELETGLFEGIDFNERNPLLALQDEDAREDENAPTDRPSGAAEETATEDTGPGAQESRRRGGRDPEAAATPPGGGTVTDVMPDTANGDRVAGMVPRCRDPLQRIRQEMQAIEDDPDRFLKKQTRMKLGNLVRRAETFCSEGQVAQAQELIDNSNELLGLK